MTIVGFEANCQSPDVFPRGVVLDALAYSVNVFGGCRQHQVGRDQRGAPSDVVHDDQQWTRTQCDAGSTTSGLIH